MLKREQNHDRDSLIGEHSSIDKTSTIELYEQAAVNKDDPVVRATIDKFTNDLASDENHECQ